MLEQLRDIHLPQAVHWWPPAPGWWLVGVLLLALTIWLSRYLQARYRRQYFRGETQALLKQLWLDYQQQAGNAHNADRDFIENTLALLRRAGKTAQVSADTHATDSHATDASSTNDNSEDHLQAMPSPALLKALDAHSAGTLSAALPLQDISERLYRAESTALTTAQAQCFYDVAKNWLKSNDFKAGKNAGSDS
ncbi:MAG: DUF4381 domain-containing protein [Gammaproteobacteria bacterium]|nr:DUF4381 domain-containing protein [Gammaproteobacteria bacterium]MBQ0840401.1 DUF4381 domain-containing protein [Gammaproteobacteria bacterium]